MSDKIAKVLSFFALIFIVFIAGSVITKYKIFPYQYLEKPYRGMEAILYLIEQGEYSPHVWVEATHSFDKSGVTRYNADKAYNGLTLYAPAHEHKAYLIDMEGKVVHSWEKKFSEIWPEQKHIPNEALTPDNMIVWRGLYLYPNGDLLAVYNATLTPTGHGLVKLDKDSNVIWAYADTAHHFVDVGEDGRVYTLTLDIQIDGIDGVDKLNFPVMNDKVAILEADGTPVKSISILKALGTSPYFKDVVDYLSREERLDISMSTGQGGDLLHSNTIRYITKAQAENHPIFKEGQLLLSFRTLDMLAMLDPEAETITWAMRGFFRAQHSPEILPNQNIILFDNQGPQSPVDVSRVMEFDPVTGKIVWSYTGSEKEPFYSWIRSHVDPLPNGNVLVTSMQNGRLFEVTREGEIVWEFFSPDRLPSNPKRVSGLHSAQRFAYEDLTFLEFNR